jgi:hypothetical protein
MNEDDTITDADRLLWAMTCMCDHNYREFSSHVLRVGGTGDLDDCRTFVDGKIRESRLKNAKAVV